MKVGLDRNLLFISSHDLKLLGNKSSAHHERIRNSFVLSHKQRNDDSLVNHIKK